MLCVSQQTRQRTPPSSPRPFPIISQAARANEEGEREETSGKDSSSKEDPQSGSSEQRSPVLGCFGNRRGEGMVLQTDEDAPQESRETALPPRKKGIPMYQSTSDANAAPIQQNEITNGSAPAAPGNGAAVTGLVLGILSLVVWLLPILGLPTSITGLVFASKARRILSPQHAMATAGFVLCIIGLALTVISALIGLLLALQ